MQLSSLSDKDLEKLRVRFWTKVRIDSDQDSCWEWSGATCGPKDMRYGHLKFPRQRFNVMAHRVAYFPHYGEDPKDFFVCHTCDNPLCCNPNHLFLGTHQDNMTDKAQKNRAYRNDHTGMRNPNSSLTEDDVVYIRSSGLSAKTLSDQYDLHISTIYLIRQRKLWQNIE